MRGVDKTGSTLLEGEFPRKGRNRLNESVVMRPGGSIPKPEALAVLDKPSVKAIILSSILVALIVFTHGVIVPFERWALGDPFEQGVLFYLPMGFWVLVAYFERWNAVVYLAPGFAIGLMLYGTPGLPVTTDVLTLAVLTGSAPAVFALLCWASGRANEPMTEPVAWRFIFTAGLFTAVITAIGLNVVRYSALPNSATLPGIIQYIAGGVVGLLTCLIVLSIAFRLRQSVLDRR